MSIAYILISKTYSLAQALDFMRGLSFRTDQMVEIPEGYKFVICYDDGRFMNKKSEVKPGIDFYYFDYNRPIPRPPIPRQDNMDISPETFQKGQTREQVKIDTQRLKVLYKGLIDYAGIPTISKTKQQMVENAMAKADILQSLEPEISTADVSFPQNVDYYIDKIRSLISHAELTPGAHDNENIDNPTKSNFGPAAPNFGPGPYEYLSDPTLDIYKVAKLPGEFGPDFQKITPPIDNSTKSDFGIDNSTKSDFGIDNSTKSDFGLEEENAEAFEIPISGTELIPPPPSKAGSPEEIADAALKKFIKKQELAAAEKQKIINEKRRENRKKKESEGTAKPLGRPPKKAKEAEDLGYTGHGLISQIKNTRYNPESIINA